VGGWGVPKVSCCDWAEGTAGLLNHCTLCATVASWGHDNRCQAKASRYLCQWHNKIKIFKETRIMSKKETKTKGKSKKAEEVKTDFYAHLSQNDKTVIERYENELHDGTFEKDGKTLKLSQGQMDYRNRLLNAVRAGNPFDSARNEVSKSFFETPQQQRVRYGKELESGVCSFTGRELDDVQKGVRLGLFNRDRKTGEAYNATARKYVKQDINGRRSHLSTVSNALDSAGNKSQAKIDEYKVNRNT